MKSLWETEEIDPTIYRGLIDYVPFHTSMKSSRKYEEIDTELHRGSIALVEIGDGKINCESWEYESGHDHVKREIGNSNVPPPRKVQSVGFRRSWSSTIQNVKCLQVLGIFL